jgi:nitrogenase cofactor biosynthesis protein NifB
MAIVGVTAKPDTHPCFGGCDAAHKYARIHLPVARDCNIKCNYCRRKFDCVNESRPGVTSKVLSPKEALERCRLARERVGNLTVVGIAGPGDALAFSSIDNTLETLRLVKESWSDAVFCLSTNGLMLSDYAQALKEAGVSHITVTVNSLRPETAMRIYRHIDYKDERLTGKEAATVLLRRQLDGIRSVSALGITCKVNTVLIKGLNDSQMTEIAEGVKKAGASLMNIMQLIPVKDTLFETIPIVSNAELNAVRTKAESILPQMRHCAQCRADAVGTLGSDISRIFGASGEKCT